MNGTIKCDGRAHGRTDIRIMEGKTICLPLLHGRGHKKVGSIHMAEGFLGHKVLGFKSSWRQNKT